MAFVVALTIPGLAVALVAYAAIERLLNRMLPSRRGRRAASAAVGFDLFHASLAPGKEDELEQRRVERLLRDDEETGAPPGSEVDLASGVVRLRLPPQ